MYLAYVAKEVKNMATWPQTRKNRKSNYQTKEEEKNTVPSKYSENMTLE